MMDTEVLCRNLTIQFGRDTEPILHDVNLQIPINKVVLLYGATGQGKTSLFNVLTGLDFSGVSQGSVHWGNRRMKSTMVANRLRSQYMGLICSHFYFLKSLDVFQNIVLPAIFAGKSEKYIRNRLALLAEVFDFDDEITRELHFIDKIMHGNNSSAGGAKRFRMRPNKVSNLSNGQREILNIARAFILDVPFIFADELLRSYSEAEADKVWSRLLDPRLGIKQNRTLFMITRKNSFKNNPQVDVIYEIRHRKVEKIEK